MISREALARRRRLGKRLLMIRGYAREEQTTLRIGIAGTDRKPCSCWMCGNPRRRYGNSEQSKTLQEKKLPPLASELDLS
jgi:hypothetical protein